MDVVYLPATERVLIIEFNPFGADMSSGAALFHWERDYDVLYGNTNSNSNDSSSSSSNIDVFPQMRIRGRGVGLESVVIV